MTTLQDVFEEQARLQRETYGKDLSQLTGEELQEAVRTHVLALLDEVHEVLHEVPWKPWKRDQPFRPAKFREELVDVLHFYVNVALIGGVTADDLLEGYARKRAINVRRQQDGY